MRAHLYRFEAHHAAAQVHNVPQRSAHRDGRAGSFYERRIMMNSTHRIFAIVGTALALSLSTASADAHRRGGAYWGPGPFWGGVAVGVGVGLGSYYYGRPYYHPGYVIVDSPPTVVYREAQPVPQAPPREPLAKAPPDPIFYPRDGQSVAQTEVDRTECNRWATTQPSAMSDASVFHRATLACMEGRGYVVK
jgi:hypothetical protein